MNNIESILAAVNSLSDSDLKILVNRIMDRLHPENALASAVKNNSTALIDFNVLAMSHGATV